MYKINNQVVKKIRLQKTDNRPIRGQEIFDENYSNIFLLAKKKSGKTTAINHILKECVGKNTMVLIFSSTLNKDKNWCAIVEMLRNRNIIVQTFTSLFDKGVNIFEEFIKNLEEEEDISSSDSEHEKPLFQVRDNHYYDIKKKEKKPRKEKVIAPEYIFIFDDLATEIRAHVISNFLKRNRHFLVKNIISSQHIHDLYPAAIIQLDYVLVFRGQPINKLKILHNLLDLSNNFNAFYELYLNATTKKYDFLYIDVREEKYRKNFNIEFQTSKRRNK